MCIPRLLRDDLRDDTESAMADVAEATSAVMDPAPEETATAEEVPCNG